MKLDAKTYCELDEALQNLYRAEERLRSVTNKMAMPETIRLAVNNIKLEVESSGRRIELSMD